MAKFLGGDGQEWEIKLTMPVLRDISRDTSLDPLNPNMAASLSIVTLTDAVWIACRKQADSRGVKRDAFFETVTTPPRATAIMETFMRAICEALEIPFPEGDAVANPPAVAVANPALGDGPTS